MATKKKAAPERKVRNAVKESHADPSDGRLFTITELSDEVGATARAIRFYESKGLLSPRRAGSNRVYDYRDRARLLIILRGKRLGFSLARIQEYLSLYDAEPTLAPQLEHLLAGTRRRIDELEAQRADLELTIEELREIEELTLEALKQPPAPSHRGRARSTPAASADASAKSDSRGAGAARRRRTR